MATAAPAIPPLAPAERSPARKRALASEYPPSSAGVVEAGCRADKVGVLLAVLLPAQNLLILFGISVARGRRCQPTGAFRSLFETDFCADKGKRVPRGLVGVFTCEDFCCAGREETCCYTLIKVPFLQLVAIAEAGGVKNVWTSRHVLDCDDEAIYCAAVKGGGPRRGFRHW